MPTMPFIDLSRQYRQLKREIDAVSARVLASGRYILGAEVEAFEREFAAYMDVPYAVGVASGTEAITLSLWAFGIGEGDGVIVSANSLPSVWGVIQAGCVPVLCDIDPQTYNLDPGALESILVLWPSKKAGPCMTARTSLARLRAILAVHLYGRPAPMEEIMAIARRYGVYVIEDCAQACGASVKYQVSGSKYKEVSLKSEKILNTKYLINNTRKVGSIGDVGIFSFYPTKNLGGYGDGGMVVTSSKRIADRVRLLGMYGEKPRYQSQIIGINSRLDELQAAILRVKLPHVDEWNEQRKGLAAIYSQCLSSLPIRLPELRMSNVKCQMSNVYCDHVYHLYVIRTKKRDQLKKYLVKKGIETMIHYPMPIHLQPSLKYLGYKRGDFPQTEKACAEILSLPLYPEIKKREVETVCQAIKEFFKVKS